MTATGAMLAALVVGVLLTLWASWFGAPLFLIQATVVLSVALGATYIVSRRHRERRH